MIDPLAPFEPTANDPFDLRKAGHLLRRAGFAGALRLRREIAAAGVAAAVERIAPKVVDSSTSIASELDTVIAFDDIDRVRAWRVWRALRSEAPFVDKVTSLWHGHFATSDRKVGDPRAMAIQLATFDRLGLGTFDALLGGVCRDPAMLKWLDNDTNTVQQPNENFARELFELFTLGRGNYSEVDVREAARCFTGWHVRDGRFRFHAHLHDDRAKSVFGQPAQDGDDVVRLTVARDESARFLATKWLRWFVHPEPEPVEIDALVTVYRRTGRDIGATLRTLLRSRLFFSPRAYRSKVKTPAEFVIGTVRSLGGRAAATDLAHAMGTMGETWLEPPSVEGWHGELAWLSPAAWLLRSNFVADLLAGRRGKLQPAPGHLFAGLRTPKDRARAAALVLLDGDADTAIDRLELVARAHENAAPDVAAAAVLHAAACLPEYQLS